MADDDTAKTDDVKEEDEAENVAEEKPAEEPEAKKESTEEAEAPAGDTATAGEATPAGTDQQGRQLYNVKCSNCGKDTQVPFQPSGGRPVYCRDCYMQKKNS